MLTRAEIPGLIFSALLVLVGVCLGSWHWRSWTLIADDPEQSTPTRWSQCRRRMQVAGLIALEGLLLFAGDSVLPILQRAESISKVQMAVLWTIDVLLMLLVAVWLALLAMGDMAVTMSQTRIELLRNRQRERALNEEIERYRKQHGEPES
jgi:hypothetical protein